MSTWRSGLGQRPAGGAPSGARGPEADLRAVDALMGVARDVADLNRRLAALEGRAHVLSAHQVWADIPDGHTVALSRVRIEARAGVDVFTAGQRRVEGVDRLETVYALRKEALLRLAKAAGVSQARARGGEGVNERTDDGSDPHLCAWTVTVEVPGAGGAKDPWSGDATVDLRDGSETVEAIHLYAADPDRELRERRAFIERAAQTAALLRALRNALGVPLELTAEGLKLPWVVVALRFDGSYSDPAAVTAFRQAQITASTAATHALFGAPPVAPGPLWQTFEPVALPPSSPRLPTPPARPVAPIRTSAPPPAPSLPPSPPNQAGALGRAPRSTFLPPATELPPPAPASALGAPPTRAPLGDEALIELALRKGRLGTGDDQVSALEVTRLEHARRVALRVRLENLPDVGAPLAPPAGPVPDTEPVPAVESALAPTALVAPRQETERWRGWVPPADEPIPF